MEIASTFRDIAPVIAIVISCLSLWKSILTERRSIKLNIAEKKKDAQIECSKLEVQIIDIRSSISHSMGHEKESKDMDNSFDGLRSISEDLEKMIKIFENKIEDFHKSKASASAERLLEFCSDFSGYNTALLQYMPKLKEACDLTCKRFHKVSRKK